MKDYLFEISKKSLKASYMTMLFATAFLVCMGTVSAFASEPLVITANITSISSDSASCGGEVEYDGGASIIVRGVCWSESENPGVDAPHSTDGGGQGSFTSSISGLMPGVTYYVRAYATNSDGFTGYGEEKSFTTLAIPVVTTTQVSAITRSSVSSGGNVTYDGGFSVTERGVCWNTQQYPAIQDTRTSDGSGTGIFTSAVSGLMPGVTYYLRAYATNSKGTSYGDQISFTTTPPITIYVKYDATGSETGESWAEATSLQAAITNAQYGDEIWVAAGTYKPARDFDRTATFELKNGVRIYGGFTGMETGRGQRDWKSNITILSGDIGAVNENSDNSFHVVTSEKTENTAVLDGFTITAGNADGSVSKAGGGGMYNYYGNPTISNCIFTNNSALSVGGGMYNNRFSSPVITNCVFTSNTAKHGGGICNNSYSSPLISGCIFRDNSADDGGGMRNENFSNPVVTGSAFENNMATFGGGMYNSAFSSPDVAQCTFAGNTAYIAGGGMCNSKDGTATLTNCTFAENAASGSGGGIYNSKDSLSSSPVEVSVTNCTFAGNISDNSDSGFGEGGGIYVEGESVTLNIRNTIVADNYKGVASPIADDCYNDNSVISSAGHNIAETGDPADFNQDGDVTGEQSELRISPLADNGGPTYTCALNRGSIAIDAGTDTSAPDIDQRGYARYAMPDIGAFEFKEPEVTTYPVGNITDTSASCGGNVTLDRGLTISVRGVCWNTSENPAIDDNRTKDGTGKGVFTSTLTGLASGTVFYVRAYAENQEGLVYGEQRSFKTIPGAPGSAPATDITSTEFTANWNPVTGADDYRLDVSATNDFTSYVSGFQHKTVSDTGDHVTGLTPGATYYYRVRAVNITGNSAYSDVITLVTIPGSPTSAQATDVSTTGFTANWEAAPGAEDYRLDVSKSSAFTSYVAGYNNKTITGTSDAVTGLTALTTYYYRVRAVNASGTGENSDITQVTTAPDPPGVSPGTDITTISFTANWNSVTGAESYLLDVSVSGDFDSYVPGYEGLPVAVGTSHSVTDLAPGSTYYYRVRAVSANGTSDYSAVQNIITVPAVPVAYPGTDMTVSTFTAVWSPVTGAESYLLDVSVSGSFDSFVTNYEKLSVSGTSQSVTGLSAGIMYYYRVRAVNTGGTGGNSSTVTVITVPDAPVATDPTGFSSAAFTANWGPSPGAEKYYLDVSGSENFTSYVPGFHDFTVTNGTNQIVSGLTAGMTYYYRVRAENTSGTSSYSNIVSSVTVPPAPTVAGASDITETSFTANWNETSGTDSYCLDVSEATDFSSYVAGYEDKTVSGTSENVAGLEPGKTYYYRVRAVNNTSGTSGNSVFIVVRTVCPGPVATDGSDITEVTFLAKWNASAGAETYHLDVSAANDFSSFVGDYDNLAVGDNTSQIVIGLTAGTIYYYRVRAVNSGGVSEDSNIVTIVTVPSALKVAEPTDITGDSFTANWEPGPGAETYRLDVSTLTDFDTYVAGYENVEVSGTSYNVTGLAGGTYYYRVRAVNTGGISKNSTLMSVKTLPPAPVAGPGSDITGTSFTANWNASAGAETYHLDVSESDDFGLFVGVYDNLNVGNKTSQNVIGLSPCTTYYYRVRAANAGGASDNSATGTVTVISAPIVTTAEVTSVTRTSASSGGNITDTCGKEITAGGVCWSTSPNPITDNSHTTDAAGPGSFTSAVTGLSPGVTYYLRAYATNDQGTSYGSDVSFTSNAVFGDADASGTIDLADVILALKVMAGLNPGNVHSSADVNNDGMIGFEEVIYALRRVVK